ncbi:homocitrate synthase NifV [Sporomusaceae bacterium BoRhaA]|uniref:homocitrate synthase/isopropylmalate synthase family protein n=1 Tax=Pelorhabdus rhamnosifermentans TaxID=2772457 RepID=UPI001C061AD2|nr:hypothetical protein [Pelorhabdus rhamnosifermentans]MBU2702106.1 homocitrate synthase NifV [Pelorhabdus rhamnosifermentans]
MDKTLQVAMNQKIPGKQLQALHHILQQLGLLQFDVDVMNWHSYLKREKITLDMQNVRGCVPVEKAAVHLAHELGFYHVCLNYVHVPQQASAITLHTVLAEAERLQLIVDWHIVNLSELARTEIVELLSILEKFAVHGLVCGDRGNCLEPFSTRRLVGILRDCVACELEFEGNNGLGLAVGNTLGAVLAGALKFAVAVGGVGKVAAFEEVLFGLRDLLHLPLEVPCLLAQKCHEVWALMGLQLPETKPIIGENIFSHESGIHVDGVNKCPELYEAFRPETVGLSRHIVIGKHSGSSAVRRQLELLQLCADDQMVAKVLMKVRSQAVSQKSSLSLQQLKCIYDEVRHERQNS